MYVVIQAYVTTMAATAMTMRSNVARIGEMAFLEFNILFIDICLIPFMWIEKMYFVFNLYETGICIPNNSKTEQEKVQFSFPRLPLSLVDTQQVSIVQLIMSREGKGMRVLYK